MEKKHMAISLKVQLTFWFAFISLLCISVVLYSSVREMNAYSKSMGETAARNYMQQTIGRLELYLTDVDNMARNIIASDTVQSALSTEEPVNGNSLDALRLFEKLQRFYSGYTNTRMYISRIILENRWSQLLDSTLFSAGEALLQSAWYTGIYGSGAMEFSGLHRQNYNVNYPGEVLTYRRAIYSIQYPHICTGYILIDIKSDILRTIFSTDPPVRQSGLLLTGASGSILYEQGETQAHLALLTQAAADGGSGQMSMQLDGEEYLLFTETHPASGWALRFLVSMQDINTYKPVRLSTLVGLSILLLLLCIAVSNIIVKATFRPLFNMVQVMKQVSASHFDVQAKPAYQPEMRALVDGFNTMIRHIKALIEQVTQAEKRKREMEVYALKAQVNPHFLNNTLNSVRYLVHAGRDADAETVVNALIRLTQASFAQSRFITIRQELSLVESYLSIQRLRYELVLDYSIDAEPQVLDCAIPGFTIQPMVENALFHGLVPNDGGTIRITAKQDADGITVIIADNGAGMDEAELNRILREMRDSASGYCDTVGFTHIGLCNVDGRIKHYFGDSYGVDIQSDPGQGTRVQIRIPLKMIEGVTTDDEASDRG